MARGRKKENLTLEERLQAALVPESEQPYKVPKNWCWVRLGEFSTSQYGYTAKAIKNDAYPKMLRITDIQECGVNWSDVPNCEITQDNLEKYRLSDGDIVIARTGATTGKSFFLNDPCNSVFASYLIRLRVNKGAFPKYVFDFLQTDHYWKQISELSSGIAQPGVNATKLQSLCFPLPPLAEQQRIVDRIESLFAKLDEAKQKAQDALDSFETRKAAILHKAFTGELTAQWRKKHGVGMESWEERTIVDLCSMIIDCPHSTPKWSDKGKICLRTTNIKDGYLDLSDVRYVTNEVFDQRNRRAVPQTGDVLLTREGNIGDVGVIPENVEICLGQRMMLLRPYKCQSAFLIYFFRNPKILTDIKAGTMGSTAPRMNIKDLKQLKIHCPNDKEQVEIVRILDDLLAKEQQAKEAAEKVLEQIDLIKKSILARAFRGELGTNDPSEESAVELLRQVLSTSDR